MTCSGKDIAKSSGKGVGHRFISIVFFRRHYKKWVLASCSIWHRQVMGKGMTCMAGPSKVGTLQNKTQLYSIVLDGNPEGRCRGGIDSQNCLFEQMK